jgi:acetyltransferase
MIADTKGYRLLRGARGRPPADVSALAEAIVRLSVLAADLALEISEIYVNPMMVFAEGCGVKAADALVVLQS